MCTLLHQRDSHPVLSTPPKTTCRHANIQSNITSTVLFSSLSFKFVELSIFSRVKESPVLNNNNTAICSNTLVEPPMKAFSYLVVGHLKLILLFQIVGPYISL